MGNDANKWNRIYRNLNSVCRFHFPCEDERRLCPANFLPNTVRLSVLKIKIRYYFFQYLNIDHFSPMEKTHLCLYFIFLIFGQSALRIWNYLPSVEFIHRSTLCFWWAFRADWIRLATVVISNDFRVSYAEWKRQITKEIIQQSQPQKKRKFCIKGF